MFGLNYIGGVIRNFGYYFLSYLPFVSTEAKPGFLGFVEYVFGDVSNFFSYNYGAFDKKKYEDFRSLQNAISLHTDKASDKQTAKLCENISSVLKDESGEHHLSLIRECLDSESKHRDKILDTIIDSAKSAGVVKDWHNKSFVLGGGGQSSYEQLLSRSLDNKNDYAFEQLVKLKDSYRLKIDHKQLELSSLKDAIYYITDKASDKETAKLCEKIKKFLHKEPKSWWSAWWGTESNKESSDHHLSLIRKCLDSESKHRDKILDTLVQSAGKAGVISDWNTKIDGEKQSVYEQLLSISNDNQNNYAFDKLVGLKDSYGLKVDLSQFALSEKEVPSENIASSAYIDNIAAIGTDSLAAFNVKKGQTSMSLNYNDKTSMDKIGLLAAPK